MHYVMSDIHGNKEAFDTMLSLIDLKPEDHLYILGDVIDRGAHGIELLQQIRAMQNCTLLLGNHEYMMINALRHPDNLEYKYLWRNNRCIFTYDGFLSLSEEEQEDDIWMMDENTYEIDLFHFVYESIVLALPIRIVHEDDADGNPTCDPEVMRRLNEMNAESVDNEQETDPRWDALKNIKLD